MKIHPAAYVHQDAKVDPSATIGPFAVIDGGVAIGQGCVIGPHVHLTGATVVGANNRFHAGCVIGDAPQDLKYGGEATRLVIGDNNVFREHVTVHRSNNLKEATWIGDGNYLMAHCHVGHNSRVGNHVIVANGALMGGHVVVEDRAFISGNCLIHQFVRIGTLSLMQGGSGVSKDVPPYTVAFGENEICGLNSVGIRRAGISEEDRLELKRLYRLLFLSQKGLTQALAEVVSDVKSPIARILTDFIGASERGVCSHGKRRSSERDGG